MLTVRHLPRRHLIRQLRRLRHHGLRTVLQHYLSMISACVLGGALTLALTSDPFEQPGRSLVQASSDVTPPPTATPWVLATPAPQPTAKPLIVYYIVDSDKTAQTLKTAVQSEAARQPVNGISDNRTSRTFIVVQSREDAAEALQVINQMAVLAPAKGYRFAVVDVR